jgi:hypothetical protein
VDTALFSSLVLFLDFAVSSLKTNCGLNQSVVNLPVAPKGTTKRAPLSSKVFHK